MYGSEARLGHLLTGSPKAPGIYPKLSFEYMLLAHLLGSWGKSVEMITEIRLEIFTVNTKIARMACRWMWWLLSSEH